jgi:hypothetical protein
MRKGAKLFTALAASIPALIAALVPSFLRAADRCDREGELECLTAAPDPKHIEPRQVEEQAPARVESPIAAPILGAMSARGVSSSSARVNATRG